MCLLSTNGRRCGRRDAVILIVIVDMVKYILLLKMKDTNDEVKYTVDLQTDHENNPEQFFKPGMREKIRAYLQTHSSYKINDINLNKIINTWIENIKEGYRDSTISLDLPLLIQSDINNLNEPGNQEMPTLISPDMSDVEPQIGALPPLIFT